MTYKFEQVTQEELTGFFMSDPKLCYLGLRDTELVSLHMDGVYPVSPHATYYKITDNCGTIGIFKYEMASDIAAAVHLYLSTKYHHTGLAVELKPQLRQLLKSALVSKVIITTPSPCIHIHKYAEKLGFTLEGTLKNFCKWRMEVVDMLIYGLEI